MARCSVGVGFHAGEPAHTTGVRDYLMALAARGHVIHAKGTDSTGTLVDLQDAVRLHGATGWGLWRKSVKFTGRTSDVPNYTANPEDEAAFFFGEISQAWPPELDKRLIYIENPNEPDKNQADWLGRYAAAMGRLCIANGYKYAAFGWSGGEPEPGHWEAPGMLDYLRLCEQYPDDLAVSLHEYTFGPEWGLLETAPWLITRVQFLNMVCDEYGIRPPRVFLSEFGWGSTDAPPAETAVPQLLEAVDWYIRHTPNVRGLAIWALDKSGQWGGIHHTVTRYRASLVAGIDGRDWPETDVGPVDPAPEQIKFVEYIYPQEAGEMEAEAIWQKAWLDYKRTVGGSVDHAIAALTSPVASPESYAVVWEPERPSQVAAAQRLAAAGVRFETRRLAPPDVLAGLRLGYLFRVPYVRTSPFNAPRDYGLHEGVDFDVVGSMANSKEPVLCVYPGVVERSLDSGGGYGRYVRVRHQFEDVVFYTRYAHLDARFVAVGAAVGQGVAVGEIGATGNVTGEHVHFNVEVPGHGLGGYVVADVVDPERYLPHRGGAVVYPPGIERYGLLDYLRGDGRLYEVQHSSGATETFQTQVSGNYFYQVKNQQWEQFCADGQFIWRGVDTSPGPAPSYAERPGNGRYYRQFEEGRNLARWCRQSMEVGERYEGPGHVVQFAYKADCVLSAANSGRAVNVVRLVAHYDRKVWHGVTVQDVVELETGTGERMFFARGFGLVAWQSQWGESAISAVHSGRPDLVRERGCFS